MESFRHIKKAYGFFSEGKGSHNIGNVLSQNNTNQTHLVLSHVSGEELNNQKMNYVDESQSVQQIIKKQTLFQHQTSDSYPIPKLPILDEMVRLVKQQGELPDLSRTIVIGVQHMLETTVSLFDAIIELGVKPENMFFTGKCYSSSHLIELEVIKRKINLIPTYPPKKPGEFLKYFLIQIKNLWEKCEDRINELERNIDRVIVLDDGGHCLTKIPKFVLYNFPIACIQQTRGGLYSPILDKLPIPVIEVASSVAKKQLESPLIAETILKKLKEWLPLLANKDKTVFGVIGNGAIGNAIVKYLLNENYMVNVYDKDENLFSSFNAYKNLFRLSTLEALIVNSNFVLGCTGTDVTKNIDIFPLISANTLLVSCTSEDREFLSLMKEIANKDTSLVLRENRDDIVYTVDPTSKITIFRGGYPINFDGEPWNVPASDIEITQGLLLGSFLQAVTSAKRPIGDGITTNTISRASLNPFIQQFVATNWLCRQPENRYPPTKLAEFNNITWIKDNSGGIYHENKFLYNMFTHKKKEDGYSYINLKAKL